MVRRYSHKAIVTIQSGQLVKGEWVAGEPTEIEVTGQYFPSNSGQQLKQNVDGKEFIVHGEFSTKIRPVKMQNGFGLIVSLSMWILSVGSRFRLTL